MAEALNSRTHFDNVFIKFLSFPSAKINYNIKTPINYSKNNNASQLLFAYAITFVKKRKTDLTHILYYVKCFITLTRDIFFAPCGSRYTVLPP